MVILHCYVSLPEGNIITRQVMSCRGRQLAFKRRGLWTFFGATACPLVAWYAVINQDGAGEKVGKRWGKVGIQLILASEN